LRARGGEPVGGSANIACACPLDAATRRDVVDTVSAQVERIYVDADTGRMIATRVRGRLAAGAYDTVSDPRALARLLTADLRTVNHDLHLSVAYSAPDPTAAGGPQRGGSLSFLARSNHFRSVRVDPPGNIGYFEINGFAVDQAAADVSSAHSRYLQTTRRDHPRPPQLAAATATSSNFLISHFTGRDTLAFSHREISRGHRIDSRAYTLASVPGRGGPTYRCTVLTSRMTGSAARTARSLLKNLERATIIGRSYRRRRTQRDLRSVGSWLPNGI